MANPVERIMAIVNLGIQCIGIMRSKGCNEFEGCISKCNSLNDIRESCMELKKEITDSLKQPKDLLASILV